MNKKQWEALIGKGAEDVEVNEWLKNESGARISWYPSSMGDISDILTFYKPDIQEVVGVAGNSLSYVNLSEIPDEEPQEPNVFIQTSAVTFLRRDEVGLKPNLKFPLTSKENVYENPDCKIRVIYRSSFTPPKTNWSGELLKELFIDPDFIKLAWLFILEVRTTDRSSGKNQVRKILLIQIPAESASFCADVILQNNIPITHVFLSLQKNLSTGFVAPGILLEEWILGVFKNLKTKVYTTNRLNNIEDISKVELLFQNYNNLYKIYPKLEPVGTAKSFLKLRDYRMEKGHKITRASVYLLDY